MDGRGGKPGGMGGLIPIRFSNLSYSSVCSYCLLMALTKWETQHLWETESRWKLKVGGRKEVENSQSKMNKMAVYG